MSGIQIPQKRLDDLGALQGQPRDSEEGNGEEVSEAHRGTELWEPDTIKAGMTQGLLRVPEKQGRG